MTAPNQNDIKLMMAIKEAKDNFNPIRQKELYEVLARDYRIAYLAYRKEGFTVLESLRLTTKWFE